MTTFLNGARASALAAALVLGLGFSLPVHADCAKKEDCCKVCDKGEPCGDSCIPAGKKCTVKQKECKEGKPCGGTCIAKDKQCSGRQHCACKKADLCK
ncbi:MAG: hypothetical protein EXR79_13970 [Myxococcales bacterium]|nr:hypothetical protein [Myxococcales bacterium]